MFYCGQCEAFAEEEKECRLNPPVIVIFPGYQGYQDWIYTESSWQYPTVTKDFPACRQFEQRCPFVKVNK